jgi:hypothetical protein
MLRFLVLHKYLPLRSMSPLKYTLMKRVKFTSNYTYMIGYPIQYILLPNPLKYMILLDTNVLRMVGLGRLTKSLPSLPY